MLRESFNSLDYTTGFIEDEGLDCDLARCGRFIGAHRPGRYDGLASYLRAQSRAVPFEWHMVPPREMSAELGTDAYHGGAVIAGHASLHPGKYANALIDLARRAGAVIETRTPVLDLDVEGDATRVATSRGELRARDVIVATNGYTGRATPGLRRRVIPIGSSVIATEPLAAGVMEKIMPRKRVISDTRKVVYYYRPSPDHRRIVFGGRVALRETDPRVSGPRLHDVMTRLFPELAATRITHSWMGFVAYTFDHMPHLGRRDGVWYATGYCGSGIDWASYLGHKVALKVLGDAQGGTALADIAFPTRPLYDGDPWFLGAALIWYRTMDRWGP